MSEATSGGDFLMLIDAKQAAAMLGIGTRTLWSMTKGGEIPHVRIRRRVLYAVEDLRGWVAKHTTRSSPR